MVACPRCGRRARRVCLYCGSSVRPHDRPQHLNADQRRALAAAEIGRFMQQYGRKAQKGVEPNDRRFDRGVELKVKRMSPVDLDRLMREDE